MSQNEPNLNIQRLSSPFPDMLSRFFCNTFEEAVVSNKTKPFDVVVIGSGMYGSYIASQLYYWSKKEEQLGEEKRLKILILEAGPYITHEHIENLPPHTDGIFEPVNKSPYICHVLRPEDRPDMSDGQYFGVGKVTKHSYCVGGKSLTWGKWSPRLTEKDLESWPKEVADFLLHKEMGYEKVEEETGVSDHSDLIKGKLYDGLKTKLEDELNSLNHLKLEIPPVAVAANSPAPGLYSPDAFSSLGGLLQAVAAESDLHRKSIFLVPNTLAYHLERDRGRVSRIDVVCGNSNEKRSFNLSSKCDVILAGTAVESTRLALNSFPRSSDRAKELIGRNLMAHLFSAITVRIKREALGFDETDIDETDIDETDTLNSALYHIQGYSERFQKSYHFQLFCSSNKDFEVFTTLYKMFYNCEAVETLKSQKSEWVTILVLSCSELPGKPEAPLGTEGSNWMDLSDQFEDFGEVTYARPYLKWESSVDDEDFWDEVLSNLFDFISSLAPFGDIEYQDPDDPQKWTSEKPTQFDKYQKHDAFWNSRHEAGTLWMGENADGSVTDLDGKLHHVQNVYCADQAIFPTVGSANPVLTGLTLDRKIAQGIIDRYKDVHKIEDADDFDCKEFRPLFDGTFNGWKIQDNGEYSILFNNILQLKPKDGLGVAWYELKTFSEFELIVDWRALDYFANSGIYIHTPDPEKAPEYYNRAYEIQIDETGYDYENDKDANGNALHKPESYGSPLHKTGAIYDFARANRGNAKKPGFWNRFRIVSSKSGIQVYLNGKLVSSLSSLSKDRNSSGHICLQFHTNEIQFRNILIKELC